MLKQILNEVAHPELVYMNKIETSEIESRLKIIAIILEKSESKIIEKLTTWAKKENVNEIIKESLIGRFKFNNIEFKNDLEFIQLSFVWSDSIFYIKNAINYHDYVDRVLYNHDNSNIKYGKTSIEIKLENNARINLYSDTEHSGFLICPNEIKKTLPPTSYIHKKKKIKPYNDPLWEIFKVSLNSKYSIELSQINENIDIPNISTVAEYINECLKN